MKLSRLERAWLPVLFSAFVDPDAPGVASTPDAVEFERVIATVLRAASFKGALGWRAGAAILMLAPMLLGGRLATLAGVAVAERNALAAKAITHRLLVIRGLSMFVKVTIGMALMRLPSVRAATHYDRRPDAPREPARPRALPVVPARRDDELQEAV
ncbi:MAG: hypothetical protein U0325_35305 [Polyangiales bacterium]